jgi:hypothetical protein
MHTQFWLEKLKGKRLLGWEDNIKMDLKNGERLCELYSSSSNKKPLVGSCERGDVHSSSSFLGSTAQSRPWPPPQNPAEFLGGFSTIFFFTG